MLNLPTVTLDGTLADLYKRAGPKYKDKRIAQAVCVASSAIHLSEDIPRNVKYLYQDGAFNECSDEDGSFCLGAAWEREWSIKMNALAQRDAFLSGNTPVVMFHIGGSDAQRAHDKSEVERTMSALSPTQRPEIRFCLGPGDMPVKEKDIDLISFRLVFDGLEGHKVIMPLETAWYINTKEALARSDLPTPRCEIVRVEGHGNVACCETCRNHDSFIIPAGCTGARGAWFSEQSAKIYQAISSHPLPFVFKNQQAYGGAGTHLVRNEGEREKLIQYLRNGALRRLLSFVNESNQHLGPAMILLTEFVADEIGNYGISFFATEDPDAPVFLAVTEQILLEGKHYIGSTIRYDRQDALKKKFDRLVKDMARWYRGYGYVGPVGVDVLETAGPSKDGQQQQVGSRMQNRKRERDIGNDEHSVFHVLDLNARPSGQLCLPLLRSHFTSRGLQCAASFFIRILKRRDNFISLFEKEFEEGRVCILSWYDDLESDVSFGNVVVGAEDPNGLVEDMQRIRDISEEVMF
jgi:hypothetical protein